MNNYRDQATAPQQQIIFAEPAPLRTRTPLPPPELEIQFGDLTPEQQAMVEESLKHHLAMALAENKAEDAAQGMVRFAVQLGELYIEAEFQLGMLEMRAKGNPHEGRVMRFLEQRGEKLGVNLNRVEDQLVTRWLIEAGKSVYRKPKLNDGQGSLLNIRILTFDKTVIKEADQDKDLPAPIASGTFFGSGIE